MSHHCASCTRYGRGPSEVTAFHRELREVLRQREAKWRLVALIGVLLATPLWYLLGALIGEWTS